VLGVSDAFLLWVPGGWQPVIELSKGHQRWVLERRASMEEARVATGHFLGTLAEAVSDAAQSRGTFGENGPEARTLWRLTPPGHRLKAPLWRLS
jgi:hypothetical protein